ELFNPAVMFPRQTKSDSSEGRKVNGVYIWRETFWGSTLEAHRSMPQRWLRVLVESSCSEKESICSNFEFGKLRNQGSGSELEGAHVADPVLRLAVEEVLGLREVRLDLPLDRLALRHNNL